MSNQDSMKLQSATQDISTINPFKIIVNDLGEDTWRKITFEYLIWVSKLLKPHNIHLETYGDVFKVLEFLAEGGAIELKVDEQDQHLIRRGYSLGKNFI